MEPKFQTSFIPKAPITSASTTSFQRGVSTSIIGTFATFAFTAAVLASGALFGYEYYLNSEIQKFQTVLVEAKSAFESEDNQKLILASNQIKSIKTLLDKHTIVSPIFELLEEHTLPTVRFTSFTFRREPTGAVVVSIEGEAQSYASLAQQSNIFSKLEYITELQFDDVELSDSGTVKMKVRAHVSSDMLLYTKKIQSVSTLPSLLSSTAHQ